MQESAAIDRVESSGRIGMELLSLLCKVDTRAVYQDNREDEDDVIGIEIGEWMTPALWNILSARRKIRIETDELGKIIGSFLSQNGHWGEIQNDRQG